MISFTQLIFKQTVLLPIYSFIDAALRFLDRMAEELGLPIKKIEVCVSDGNLVHVENIYVHAVSTIQILVVRPHQLFPLPLGLSRQSCVDHDMGRDGSNLEIHRTEFPYRCCTCFPGMASVSVHDVTILLLSVIDMEKIDLISISSPGTLEIRCFQCFQRCRGQHLCPGITGHEMCNYTVGINCLDNLFY